MGSQPQRPSGHLPGAGPSGRRRVRRRDGPHARRQGWPGRRRWRARAAGGRRHLSVQRVQRRRSTRAARPDCWRAPPAHGRWTTVSWRRSARPAPTPTANDDCAVVAVINSVQGYWTDDLRRVRHHLPGGGHGLLQRLRPDRVRHGLRGDGSVLLPARPAGLHRPVVLGRAEEPPSGPTTPRSPRPTCSPTSTATTCRTCWAPATGSAPRPAPRPDRCGWNCRRTATPGSGPTTPRPCPTPAGRS